MPPRLGRERRAGSDATRSSSSRTTMARLPPAVRPPPRPLCMKASWQPVAGRRREDVAALLQRLLGLRLRQHRAWRRQGSRRRSGSFATPWRSTASTRASPVWLLPPPAWMRRVRGRRQRAALGSGCSSISASTSSSPVCWRRAAGKAIAASRSTLCSIALTASDGRRSTPPPAADSAARATVGMPSRRASSPRRSGRGIGS
mmetsp:Transcript_7452/g.21128  ORF Transcript_7452/g.21128 Transcript_7452/m.21128 type:complete len:202 (+) Transcript_7452:362-967(+)